MPTRDTLAADAVRALVDRREELRDAHARGLPGTDLVRSLAEAVDEAVVALWSEEVGDRGGVALVALGGYGRGELSPFSDLDLMVLHAGRRPAADEARALFYPLWDAGLEVGHAVRTVRECVKLARSTFDAATSFLDARRITGDSSLYEEFRAATLLPLEKRSSAFISEARAVTRARHAKPANASCLLEPNLKDGAGGLRDVATLGWLARVTGGPVLDDPDAPRVEGAKETLLRVRNHLHYHAGRRQDVLSVDVQEQTALALGWNDEEGWSAWDAFMRDVYRATRSVEHALARAFARLEVVTRRRGGAEAPSPIAPDETPEGRGWDDRTRRRFFDVLATGDDDALPDLDQSGALAGYLPEWEMVRHRPQHNVYHRFTVDMHAYQTVARLRRLTAEEGEPIAARVVRDVSDRDLLLLAGLLHDLGKGYPGDHSEAGQRLAWGIAIRAGFDRGRAETLAWLVRHHLLLVDTATRRDTGDENLVVELAAQIGDPERLRMLYALSVADGLATGPTAWSAWKSALTAELFARLLHVLERGELTSRDASELVRLRRAELRAALDQRPQASVEAHINGMSRAYFLAFPTSTLIRHFALMAERVPAGEIRTHVAPTDERELSELTLVAADRPGLFSLVSGALSLSGVNVVTAQIFTRSDGVALEVFRVTGALDPTIEPARWTRVFDDVRAGLREELSLDAALAEKRLAYAERPRKSRPRPAQVVIDHNASDFYTVVEVHADDRIGLLYAVTKTLADLRLDIHLAKIATYGEEVVDAFYVRDLEGQKIVDPARIAAVAQEILASLEEAQGT